MFKMEVKTGGAAFCNPDTGEEDKVCEGLEIARLLREIADVVEVGIGTSGSIVDINGNKVGSWSR